jgi:hypothetical protein
MIKPSVWSRLRHGKFSAFVTTNSNLVHENGLQIPKLFSQDNMGLV